MSNVTVGRYLLGIVAALIIVASLGLTAVLLRRRFLPEWGGAPARLAEAVIGLAALTGLLEGLGAVGLFRLGWIVAACGLLGLGTTQALGGAGIAHARAARVGDLGSSKRLAAAAVVLIVAAVAAEWAGPTLESYEVGIRTLDSLWYHLPWAASFAQTGHITSLHFTDVEYLTAFYPATAELFHGLGIVLFGRDTLSPGINLLWLGLVLLAVYCVGRPQHRGHLTLTAAALAIATPAVVQSQAGSAANDIVGVFFVLAAVALLGDGGERRAPFVLAAVSAGLAVSVKLSMLAVVLALSVGAVALSPSRRRRASAALWFGPLLLAGGFWYFRNLIAVGNPLPWLGLPGLPRPAAPLQQHTAFTVAHYLTNTNVISHVFEPGLSAGLGPWWPVLLALGLIGPLLCLAPGAGRTVRILGLVALAGTAAYLLTPESAAGPAGQPLGFAFNLRYAAPALTLSLAIFPLAPAFDSPRRRAAALGLLGLTLVATLAQGRLWSTAQLPAALGLAAAIVAAALACRLEGARSAANRLRGAAGAGRALRLGAAAMLVVLLGAGAGYAWQSHYLRGRYAFHPGISYLGKVWAYFRGVHDQRVGLVGTFGGFFAYPLFGADDSNRVQYVGRRAPHGSFTALGSCAAWRAAVNDGGYRYLVATPARDPWHPKPLTASPESVWTGSDPAARLILSRRAGGQRIFVYELSGRLGPSRCPRP